MCQRPADDGETSVTSATDGVLSQWSTASNSATRRRGLGAAEDDLRKRYLYRLGIAADAAPGSSPSGGDGSLSSLSRSSSSQDKIILLRHSHHYTTTLKSDPNASASSFSDHRHAADEPSDPKLPRSPPPPKFDLSAAWAALLAKDAAGTTSASARSPDGAYDLFSLPGRHRSLDGLAARAGPPSPAPRKVSFDATVQATTIPSRRRYSDRVRRRLWSSSEDIRANAVRSEREYAHDGRDWRTASEEGDFVRCPAAVAHAAGLVHPAHGGGWPSPPRPWQPPWPPPGTEEDGAGEAQPASDDECLSGVFDMDME